MEREISRKSFVRLGTLLGVGAAGSSVLAACGGGSGSGASGSGDGYGNVGSDAGGSNAGGKGQKDGDNGGDSGGRPQEEKAAGQKPAKGKAIARTSEVRSGSAVKFRNGGQPAVLVHLDGGDFVAYSAVCTHAGCEVGYKNGQLACPCHGSVFDPANGGEVVSPPADQPLQKIPVEVRGGEVFRA